MWPKYIFSNGELFGYDQSFPAGFLKKIFLLMSYSRKYIAVSLNKESQTLDFQFTTPDLATLTEEILKGKLHFLFFALRSTYLSSYSYMLTAFVYHRLCL